MAVSAGSPITKTFVGNLNPLSKFVFVMGLGLAALITPTPWLGLVLVLVYFGIAASCGLLKHVAKIVFGFGIPITVMLFFIQGFYSPANKTYIADFGFAKLGLEGLMNMGNIVSTLLVFLAGLYIFNNTTYMGRLVASLTDINMSPKAGYLVLATVNVVPQMQRKMHVIQEAQAARGLKTGGGAMDRFKAFIPLLGPVVMSSLTDAQERGMTLETHGFSIKGVEHTHYVDNPYTGTDKAVTLIGVVFFLAVLLFVILTNIGII